MTISQAFDLALQHHRSGRLADAEALYRQILAVRPDHAGALHFLGLIADQAGRHDLAVELIRQAIGFDPQNPLFHSNLAEALRGAGRLDEAITACRRALDLKPDFPNAHLNLGNALLAKNQLDEAIAAYRRALALDPDYPEAHSNLGNALREKNQLDEAIAACHRALQNKPHFPGALNNLGNALRNQGRLDESIAQYRRALDLKPAYPEALSNLSVALREQGQLDQAIAACRRALELQPGYAEGHNNLGIALNDNGQLDEAMAAYRRALELKPNYPGAHSNLGNALRAQGRLDDAIAAYRRALELKPDHTGAHGNLLYTLHFHPGCDPASISDQRRCWNRQFSQPLKRFIPAHSNDRNPERRLRIGYVSPDFRDHVVGRNLAPLFERHDRDRFEIFCYAAVARPDEITEEFRRRADHWRSTLGVGDEALARMIQGDGIDILVDLSQHMAGHRLPVFARKPAPVQVSFAGYPESTGLDAIENRISDRHLEGDSESGAALSAERVWTIDSFWCYDPRGMDVAINALPAMDSGTITFGCLNNFCKVTNAVLSLWARVLGDAPNSRLILMAGAGSQRQRTLETLGRAGVAGHRVEFVEHLPRRKYLELYHRLDVVLDTFPYNGHTTSLDALWMGVPVVSVAGKTPVSRAGLSQLTNVGLPELIAHSDAEYIHIAHHLTADPPRLANLRATLRARMQASPLMDAARFARNVEAAYREMWRRWCEDPSPMSDSSEPSDQSAI